MLASTFTCVEQYIYQGEEFGMKNPYFTTIEQYRDVEALITSIF
ncbi:MAG: hypothetical protein ACLRQX_11635 [Turicibacter sanguinis]